MQTNPAKLPYLLLTILAVGSALFYAATTAANFDSFLNADRARPPLDYSHTARFLVQPLPESQSAGMVPEDEVLSVNGLPFTGMAGLIRQTFHARPGQVASIVYRNMSGQIRTAHVGLMPRRRGRPTVTGWLVNILLILIFPAFCLLLGYWVVLARPLEANAWFFLGIMNVVPAFVSQPGYYPGFLAPFTIFWRIFAFSWMFISLILFSIYFPVRSRTDMRYPWLKWLIIIPQIPLVPATCALEYGLLYHARSIQPYLSAFDPLQLAGNVFAAISLCIFITAIVSKLFHVPEPDARRRLGVVAAGSLLGLGPLLVLLLNSTFSQRPILEMAPSWALFTVALLFTFFPLSLAYTVIVQRALDLRIILRQGTRYAFARGTLWVLQASVLAFLTFRIFRFAHTSGRVVAHLIAPGVFVVVVLFLRLRIARPLSMWLDRRFFREAYSVDQVLTDLSEQARTFTETEPLLRTIVERIGQTLHVERISFLLRRGNRFSLQYAQGIPATIDVSLADNSSTIRALAIGRSPKQVYLERPDPWLALAPASELSVLSQLDAELLLPLPGRSGLIGVMALGPKLSEEPYSRSDRQLLSSVALQTGLAIENSSLVHRLAEESAQRQRIDREIEIAREVQERLLPQTYPVVPGIDFAAYSRAAREVGGDYYDFIPLENGTLGIAIGDVSGKGISSALLMASIRAALHGLTFSGDLSLARVIEGLNRIIFDSSTSNRFVTFFFGEYDPVTRTLDYVNAGHNAPVLLRPSVARDGFCSPGVECTVQRLEIGGPVLGIFTDVHYEQGTIQLRPYDALIAFTDGISEAMTVDLEEWGEERLITTARMSAHRPAQDMVTAVIASADRFTAGAPQSDDLSLVVLKVL
jgi:phosphoserine phosphatase RsbU/P